MTPQGIRSTRLGQFRPGTSQVLFSILLVFALGCSTKIPGLSLIAPTANPNEEITTLASDVEAARSDNLDVLSPTWFGRADESAKNAKSKLAKGESVQSILRDVAEGQAALKQARTYSAVTLQTLPDVIKARADARDAGAAGLGARYDRVEKRFLELTAGIESDSMSWARKTAPEVEQEFRGVELASIKRNTVYRIVDLISKAKEVDAERLAPDLLRDVENRYAELDGFIAQNRYSSDAMGEKAEEVLFFANRLVYVTEEAKRLEGVKATDLALESEGRLLMLSQKLELPDLRNQSQSSQRRQIENAIDELLSVSHDLRRKTDSLQARVTALQSKSEQEQSQLAALEYDREVNQKFAEITRLFGPGEAEVYKKGSQLVIRVRSLQFPVGSANVGPESYPILAKVQQAIKSFERPRVVVEGHTDSTGSAEVNDRISQERADAVLAYLVANNTIEGTRVSAVGMGFSEPLASDRTAEGRAENRRIDVVIDASDGSSQARPAVAAR